MPGDPSSIWPIAVTPAFLVSILASLLSALVYHALFGRNLRGFGLAMIAALLGFTGGVAYARWSGTAFGLVGAVHVLQGLVGAWIALIAAGIFGRSKPSEERPETSRAASVPSSPPDRASDGRASRSVKNTIIGRFSRRRRRS